MKPIGGFALLQAREEGRKIQRMRGLLRHSAVYFVFIWVAFVITYRAHNTSSFPVNAAITDAFTLSVDSDEASFSAIRT